MKTHRYVRDYATAAWDRGAECDPKVVFRLRRRRILDGAKDRIERDTVGQAAQVWDTPPEVGFLAVDEGVVRRDPALRAALMSGEVIDERLYGIGRHAPEYEDPLPLVLTGDMRAASGRRR